jgi:hypothetical protein
VDLSIDYQSLRLRAELAGKIKRYEPGKREPFWGIPGMYAADTVELDAYLLAAYRLPWWGLEPYGYLEVYHWPTILGDGMIVPSVGLNVHFGAGTQLKLQVAHVSWVDFDDLSNDEFSVNDMTTYDVRLVETF